MRLLKVCVCVCVCVYMRGCLVLNGLRSYKKVWRRVLACVCVWGVLCEDDWAQQLYLLTRVCFSLCVCVCVVCVCVCVCVCTFSLRLLHGQWPITFLLFRLVVQTLTVIYELGACVCVCVCVCVCDRILQWLRYYHISFCTLNSVFCHPLMMTIHQSEGRSWGNEDGLN